MTPTHNCYCKYALNFNPLCYEWCNTICTDFRPYDQYWISIRLSDDYYSSLQVTYSCQVKSHSNQPCRKVLRHFLRVVATMEGICNLPRHIRYNPQIVSWLIRGHLLKFLLNLIRNIFCAIKWDPCISIVQHFFAVNYWFVIEDNKPYNNSSW